MAKVTLGPGIFVFNMPVVIVGANVDGRPNFMTVAAAGVACTDPPLVSLAIRPTRYTYKGIRQNMTFSVNVPSTDLVRETDYCGLVSGTKVNKAEACGFKVFYGKATDGPMVEQCPVNMECRVTHIMLLGSHVLVIGKIEDAHASEECLTNGRPDLTKIRPFVYAVSTERQYQAFGEPVGKAFSIGNEIKPPA